EALRALGDPERIGRAHARLKRRAIAAGWKPVVPMVSGLAPGETLWARATHELELVNVTVAQSCDVVPDTCGLMLFVSQQVPLPPLHRGFPLCPGSGVEQCTRQE